MLSYDAGDRLTEANDSKVTTPITRQYGTSGTSLASGLDFMTQEVTQQGTVNYVPDPAGRRTSMTVKIGTSSQPPVNYYYDYADKLTSVSQNGLTTTKVYGDPAGRLSSVTLPNGVVVSYGYDRNSNVTSLTYKNGGGTTLGNLTYGYDGDDQRVSVGGSYARTNLPTTAQSFSYNPDNSLKTLGSFTVTNDNNGNITCMSSTSGCPQFAFDERGHLAQVQTQPSFYTDYSYDALGRRYEMNVTGLAATTYQYDGLNAAETWLDGITSSPTTYQDGLGLDELFNSSGNSLNDSFLRDGLNSTIALTNASGSVIDQTTYDPYGATSDSAPTQASPFEFTGRENDGNGLYYLRGRYYAPAIGRYISRDPVGFAGGFNLYEYAGDDPTNATDVTGMDCGADCCGGWSPGPNWPNPNPTGGGGGGEGVGPGYFQLTPLAPVANQNGIGSDIIPIYRGQNGGGEGDPDNILEIMEISPRGVPNVTPVPNLPNPPPPPSVPGAKPNPRPTPGETTAYAEDQPMRFGDA